MAGRVTGDRNDSPQVGWTSVVRFIRQLSHDLRNHLNAAELQAVYIGELGDSELKAEVKRLRGTIGGLSAILQKLSSDLYAIQPNFMRYRAADFFEDVRKKAANVFPENSAAIKWNIALGDATLNIDPQLMQQALIEVFANAFQHSPGQGEIAAGASIDAGHLLFTLREPKAQLDLPTENWGREPLRAIRQGHYCLGLNRVRVIVEGHSGTFSAHYDPAERVLVTTITLPLSVESE